jgi:hypothetical protein
MQRFGRGEEIGDQFDEQHFFPQNWRCHYSQHLTKYKIIRFTNSKEFFTSVFAAFEKQGVPKEDIDFLREQIDKGRKIHSTDGKLERAELERKIRADPYLMKMLVHSYYYDFLLLDYPFPEVPTPLLE